MTVNILNSSSIPFAISSYRSLLLKLKRQTSQLQQAERKNGRLISESTERCTVHLRHSKIKDLELQASHYLTLVFLP